MHSGRASRGPAAVLILLGVGFAAGNLWHTTARSAIPWRIDGSVVTEKQRRFEKTLGVDDVCLVRLDDGDWRQVDSHVFATMTRGAAVRKRPWSYALDVNDRAVMLEWSADFRGMIWAMPLAMAILCLVEVSGRRGGAGGEGNEQGKAVRPSGSTSTVFRRSTPAVARSYFNSH